jgi:hypothetical protein
LLHLLYQLLRLIKIIFFSKFFLHFCLQLSCDFGILMKFFFNAT